MLEAKNCIIYGARNRVPYRNASYISFVSTISHCLYLYKFSCGICLQEYSASLDVTIQDIDAGD